MKTCWLSGLLAITALVGFAGCDSSDARLAKASQEAAARQAEQNQELARVVQAQQSVQHEIQAERNDLNAQRTALEEERRQAAGERSREPIIANAIVWIGVLIGCSLPLALGFLALRLAHRSDADDAAVCELLIQEITAEHPTLLPWSSPRAVATTSPPLGLSEPRSAPADH